MASAAAQTVVVVESPTKATKIQQFLSGLDGGVDVYASRGHFRNLPSTPGAVDPDNRFAMHWQIDSRRHKLLAEIEAAAKDATRVVLATDPDREGEAISWHMEQYLRSKNALSKGAALQRVTFTSVTRDAVLDAMAAPRTVDAALVDAYLTRLAMDFLLGFNLSPVLWRKLPGTKSAGRVQSPALRLICERELERDLFVQQEYYSVDARLAAQPQVLAQVVGYQGRKVSTEQEHGLSSEDAHAASTELQRAGAATLQELKRGAQKRAAPRPYITSSLQQDAARLLHMGVKSTMSTAQELFEEGLITYHRTDGLHISPEKVEHLRATIAAHFAGSAALPAEPRTFKFKTKNAQEAHEAIVVTAPDTGPQLPATRGKRQRALYELIWRRSVACQMGDAQFNTVRATLSAGECELRANGRAVREEGYLEAWSPAYTLSKRYAAEVEQPAGDSSAQSREDDVDADEAATASDPASLRYQALKGLQKGATLAVDSTDIKHHETQPPGRYSEGSLVKKLEELGIGRPSTYASIIDTLQQRQYAQKQGSALMPTSTGRLLTSFLNHYFPNWVDFQFSSAMEDTLDSISAGSETSQTALGSFWQRVQGDIAAVQGVPVTDVMQHVEKQLESVVFPTLPDGADPRKCPLCADGKLYLRISAALGGFVACSNYATEGRGSDAESCTYRRHLLPQDGDITAPGGGEVLGQHPDSGADIKLVDGPYGRFLEYDNAQGDRVRQALPKLHPAAANGAPLSFEEALKLLQSSDIVLGTHKETGLQICYKIGHFGPYYEHGSLRYSAGPVAMKAVKADKGAEGSDWEPSLQHALERLDQKAHKLGTTQVEAAQAPPAKGKGRKAKAKAPAAKSKAKAAPKTKAKGKAAAKRTATTKKDATAGAGSIASNGSVPAGMRSATRVATRVP